MEIVDENGKPIENPDLSLGRIEIKTKTVHHDAVKGVEEKGHWETVKEYDNGGKDVQWIVDTPGVEAVPAWDETVEYGEYILYTAEELALMEQENTRLDDIEASICEIYEMLLGGVE